MKHQETALTLHKVVPMYIAPLLLMGSNEHCNAGMDILLILYMCVYMIKFAKGSCTKVF